jgi:hypothetical protein
VPMLGGDRQARADRQAIPAIAVAQVWGSGPWAPKSNREISELGHLQLPIRSCAGASSPRTGNVRKPARSLLRHGLNRAMVGKRSGD